MARTKPTRKKQAQKQPAAGESTPSSSSGAGEAPAAAAAPHRQTNSSQSEPSQRGVPFNALRRGAYYRRPSDGAVCRILHLDHLLSPGHNGLRRRFLTCRWLISPPAAAVGADAPPDDEPPRDEYHADELIWWVEDAALTFMTVTDFVAYQLQPCEVVDHDTYSQLRAGGDTRSRLYFTRALEWVSATSSVRSISQESLSQHLAEMPEAPPSTTDMEGDHTGAAPASSVPASSQQLAQLPTHASFTSGDGTQFRLGDFIVHSCPDGVRRVAFIVQLIDSHDGRPHIGLNWLLTPCEVPTPVPEGGHHPSKVYWSRQKRTHYEPSGHRFVTISSLAGMEKCTVLSSVDWQKAHARDKDVSRTFFMESQWSPFYLAIRSLEHYEVTTRMRNAKGLYERFFREPKESVKDSAASAYTDADDSPASNQPPHAAAAVGVSNHCDSVPHASSSNSAPIASAASPPSDVTMELAAAEVSPIPSIQSTPPSTLFLGSTLNEHWVRVAQDGSHVSHYDSFTRSDHTFSVGSYFRTSNGTVCRLDAIYLRKGAARIVSHRLLHPSAVSEHLSEPPATHANERFWNRSKAGHWNCMSAFSLADIKLQPCEVVGWEEFQQRQADGRTQARLYFVRHEWVPDEKALIPFDTKLLHFQSKRQTQALGCSDQTQATFSLSAPPAANPATAAAAVATPATSASASASTPSSTNLLPPAEESSLQSQLSERSSQLARLERELADMREERDRAAAAHAAAQTASSQRVISLQADLLASQQTCDYLRADLTQTHERADSAEDGRDALQTRLVTVKQERFDFAENAIVASRTAEKATAAATRAESLKRKAEDDAAEQQRRHEERVREHQEEQRRLEEQLENERLTCSACLDAQPAFLYQPCGHATLCEQCDQQLRQQVCPKCRDEIHTRHRVYF